MFDSDARQVCGCNWIVPQAANLFFFHLASWSLDSHHDPFVVGIGPDRGVGKNVVEGSQNCFGLVYFQLINRKPKGSDSTLLQAPIHEREKLLGVKINRSRHLGRWWFSR